MESLEKVGWIARATVESLRSVRWGWGSSLMGACGVSAYVSWKVLLKLGCPSSFVMGEELDVGSHCWAETTVGDVRYVVDATATQFDARLPKVIVMPVRQYRGLSFCQRLPERYVNEEALGYLREWPVAQTPWAYAKEIRAILKYSVEGIEGRALSRYEHPSDHAGNHCVGG